MAACFQDHDSAPLNLALEAMTRLLAAASVPQSVISPWHVAFGKEGGTTHVNIADTNTPSHDHELMSLSDEGFA